MKAVQYDSDKGFITWIDKLKKEVPEISSNTRELLSLLDDLEGADDEFLKFIDNVDTSKDIMSQYQQHLYDTGKATSTFTTITKKAGSVIKSIGAALGSMAVNWAIGEVIGLVVSSLSELAQISDIVSEKAATLGRSFSDTKSDLDDYKGKIAELRATINDSNSSISEVVAARKELMSVQEEMISKYGTEKGSIEAITEAINGQADAFDKLKEKQWQTTKNDFNDGSMMNDFGNFMFGYRDNIDRMVDDMEDEIVYIRTNINKESLDFVKALEEAGYNYSGAGGGIKLDGNLEKIYDDILNIQDIASNYDVSDSFLRNLTKEANKAKDTLEDYSSIWNEYILRDRILENDDLANSWKKVNDAYAAYQTATESGSETDVANTVKGYAEVLSQVTNGLADKSVIDYFNSMYPELKKMADKYQTFVDNFGQDKANSLSPDDLAIAYTIENAGDMTFDELKAEIERLRTESENPIDINAEFNIGSYEKSIDEIQSTVDTLRKALDSFNQGTLDESAVLDLMQQFPALIPYIDLAADGFGNLSQGLSDLIAQQPNALIESLEQLKESLNTDEERAQVDMLIDSLQRLSSYGDTGMEAYATSIGATWNDTANVIGSVTTQFENLAKVQEAVSNGLTMSATAAAELAQMYPEILTNCEVAANGQITLNEDVVKSILAGDQSIVDAQITKLEADKAVLEAKQRTAEAELEIIKNVGTAKGQITEEEARNQIEALEAELKAELEKDRQTVESYAVATESKMQNASQFDTHVATVASDIATNMLSAAVSMASNMKLNSESSQQSLIGIGHKAAEVARSVAAIGTKQVVETSDKLYSSSGSIGGNIAAIGTKNIPKMVNNVKNAVSATRDYLDGNIDLGDFQSQLELDIKGYSDAIANIDGQIAVLKNLQATFKDTVDSANGGIGGHNYADKIKQLEDEKDKINSALDDAKSGSGSSSKEAEDNFEELVDFFLRRIDVLDSALSLLKAHLDNVTGSFAKNQLVDAQLGITEEKFKNYSDALNMYTQKANEALSKLPSDIAAKVKDGAVDLTTFIGEGNKDVVEAIKDYENWAGRIADCKEELASVKKALRELEFQKFENIVKDFTDQFDLREDSKSLISKQIALLEEAGELIGESFFNAQIDQSNKQLALLEEEKAQLVSQMESAINSGRVEKGTTEWLSMASSISNVEGEILNCRKAIEEFDNELLNLNWQIFERIQTEFGNISSELDNLAGLFDDFNDIRVSDGKGTWTREAIATLGLYAQQYEVAKYQVEQYSDAMDKLKQDYIEGRLSATEYMDKLADLSSGQWDAVKSAESLEDSIYNLNKTRIEEEIETIEDEIEKYKELTDQTIKNLEAQKDLHEYKESIAEKNKTITDLEKEIAAMSGDTSAATQAKIKLKQQQLAEARKDLEEYEYDHNIESQKDALNQEYQNFEDTRNQEIEALRLSLENRELIISKSFENVKANADIVGQEIANIAVQHGVTVSDAIITSWQNGEGAIASYGSVLNDATSAFIGNLMGVEYKVYDLQNQANATADTLAWMFGTRADTLVNELTTSYYSEQNLANMTNALQQSLVNALERGYNISSITNALGSIESAARSAKAAIDSLNSTPVNTSPSYNGGSGGGGNGSSGSGSGSSGSTSNYSLRNQYEYHDPDKYKRRLKLMPDGRQVLIKYAKGGVVKKDPHNPFNPIAEAVGEDTMVIASEGETIMNKEQTDELNEHVDSLRKFVDSMGGYKDGDVYVIPGRSRSDSQVPLENMPADLAALDPVSLSNNIRSMPEIASSNVDKSVKISYGSLVTINGNVNDTHAFIDDTQKMIRKELVRHDREVVRSYRYG